MRPDSKARRQAVHLHQEERRQNQDEGLQGMEADAGDVAEEQEALQEAIPSEEPRGDGSIGGEGKVQPHGILKEEESTEERTQTEGPDVQLVDNR